MSTTTLTTRRKLIAGVAAAVLALLAVLSFGATSASAATLEPEEGPQLSYEGDSVGQTACYIFAGKRICDKISDVTGSAPPPVQYPNSGTLGVLGLPPAEAPDGDPFAPGSKVSLWESSGLGGFKTDTYDLDTGSLEEVGAAGVGQFSNWWSNVTVEAGISVTSITASISELSIDPTWLTQIVGPFASQSAGILRSYIWLPFLALGLLAASVGLMWLNRQGNISFALTGALHTMAVIALGLIVLQNPLRASETLQSTTAALGSALGSANSGNVQITPYSPTYMPPLVDSTPGAGLAKPGTSTPGVGLPAADSAGPAWARPASAVDAATADIVRSVHYNGWLRRTFGSENAGAAREYGPRMWAAQRFTWAEYRATESDPAARTALVKQKNEDWTKLAAEVKEKYPEVYPWVQGQVDRSNVAAVELGFVLVANLFRFFAAALLMLACLVVAVCGLLMLLGAPWFVTPWGRGDFRKVWDSAFRAAGYALFAAIMSWLFGVYCTVVLAPGLPTVLVAIALVLGTAIFWSLLRPDRKMLAMLAPGRVDSLGATGHKIRGLLGSMAGTLIGSKLGSKAGVKEAAEEAAPQQRVRSEDFVRPAPGPMRAGIGNGPATYQGGPADGVQEGTVINREPLVTDPGSTTPAPAPGAGRVIPGEVIESTPGFYKRPTASPPVADVQPSRPSTDVEIYQRPSTSTSTSSSVSGEK